jgi:ADP-ribose pyrophosphatase YjhB (NUDIX family)
MTSTAHPMYRPRNAADVTVIRVGAALIIRDSSDRILMERRSDCGLWGFVGGRVDAGETIEQAATREAFEETGLEIQVDRLLGIYSGIENRVVTFPDNVVQLVDVVMTASILSGELTRSHESEALQFFALDDLPPQDSIVPPAWQPLDDYQHKRDSLLR